MAEYAREEINAVGGYYAFGKELCNGNSVFDFDTTKLSVHTLDIGLAGIEVYDILRDEYDIQIEFGDIGNILAYLSIGDRPQEVERLVSALAEIKRRYHTDGAGLLSQEYIDPEVAASPQEAFYAPKKSLPLRETEGMVCSEFVMCYPPGIPILAPGERITAEILDYIEYAKAKGCSMTGPEDPDILRLNVLAQGVSEKPKIQSITKNTDLSGKDAVFNITINYIEEKITPEFDDDFIAENLPDYESAEAYRQSVYDNLYKQNMYNALFQYVVENSEIKDVPEEVVDTVYNERYQYYTSIASMYGVGIDAFLSANGLDEDSFRDMCKTYAGNYLVLQAVMETEGWEMTADLLRLCPHTPAFLLYIPYQTVPVSLSWRSVLQLLQAEQPALLSLQFFR